MRQTITVDQLNELSDKAKERLASWVLEKGYAPGQVVFQLADGAIAGKLPLALQRLSIGQMIEFLDESHDQFLKEMFAGGLIVRPTYVKNRFEFNESEFEELCDALWQAVKEALEQ